MWLIASAIAIFILLNSIIGVSFGWSLFWSILYLLGAGFSKQ